MILTLFLPTHLLAGGWAKTFGDLGDESASSVRQTTDGGCIVAGNSSEGTWLIKLDSTSMVSWQKTYSAGSVRSVHPTIDGNVDWEMTYGGTEEDLAYFIQQTSDSGYVVVGETFSFGAGDGDIWILKLEPAGGVTWQYAIGGELWDYGTCVQQTDDEGYIVSGVTYSYGPNNGDIWVLKLHSNGTVDWEKAYGYEIGNENTESDPCVRQTVDGGYIVAGTTTPVGINSKAWVLKLHADGGIDWQKVFSTIPDYIVSSIQQTADNGYILSGKKGYYDDIDFLGDAWVMKLDDTGIIEWEYTYGGSESPEVDDDYVSSIQQMAGGDYIAAGATRSFGMGGYDLWLLKIDSNGQVSNCSAASPWSGTTEDTFETGTDSTETATLTAIAGVLTVSTVTIPTISEMDGCNPFIGNRVDLPETGQTTSSYPGDDGDLRQGVDWPSPRFFDNGNGTVTDVLTGLVWLKDANCANTIGHDPDGTGDGSMTWSNALTFVAGINDGTYDIAECGSYTAGETDWRVSNIIEIESLVHSGEINTAEWLNTQGFENAQFGLADYDRYWSSTTYFNNFFYAWGLYMGDGWVSSAFKSPTTFYVWPVRAGQDALPDPAYPANPWKSGQTSTYHTGDDGDLEMGVAWPSHRFVDMGDGTVIDALTGLMWLKDADCFGYSDWQTALDVVADFNTTPTNYDCADYDEIDPPHDDWSLPNRKELFSLIDYSKWEPALPPDHPFLNAPTIESYWTSTTYAPITDHAWYGNMRNGTFHMFVKSSPNYRVWPVRLSGPLPDIRANGSDGPLTLSRGSALSVTVALDAMGRIGDGVDWWLLALTPFGWYHYNVGSGWAPDPGLTYSGPLFDLPKYEVLNMSILPAGSYTFYFGVDMEWDGSLDLDQTIYDSVEVTITP
jgi:hypothetical protein